MSCFHNSPASSMFIHLPRADTAECKLYYITCPFHSHACQLRLYYTPPNFQKKIFKKIQLSMILNNWRASEASETLSGVYKFELVRYIYIYMYGGTYAILVAHATHT